MVASGGTLFTIVWMGTLYKLRERLIPLLESPVHVQRSTLMIQHWLARFRLGQILATDTSRLKLNIFRSSEIQLQLQMI